MCNYSRLRPMWRWTTRADGRRVGSGSRAGCNLLSCPTTADVRCWARVKHGRPRQLLVPEAAAVNIGLFGRDTQAPPAGTTCRREEGSAEGEVTPPPPSELLSDGESSSLTLLL